MSPKNGLISFLQLLCSEAVYLLTPFFTRYLSSIILIIVFTHPNLLGYFQIEDFSLFIASSECRSLPDKFGLSPRLLRHRERLLHHCKFEKPVLSIQKQLQQRTDCATAARSGQSKIFHV